MSTRTTTSRDAAALPLAAQMLADEHGRHANRLASIKRMSTRLAILDAFMPAITAAGIELNLDEVHDWGGKTIYLGSGILDHTRNAKLANVLMASGMSPLLRTDYDYGNNDVRLELVKGRLRLSLNIDGRAKHLLKVPACA